MFGGLEGEPGDRQGAQSVERLLGRRLRPWWGVHPVRLMLRGIVQGAIAGFLLFWAVQALGAGATTAELEQFVPGGTIRLIATVVIVGALLVILYGVLRVVVGIIGLSGRHATDGHVIQVTEQPVAERLFRKYRRFAMQAGADSNASDYRQRQTVLVLQTAKGVQTWIVGRKHAQQAPGTQVRVTAMPITGYVTGVQRIA